MLSRVVLPAIQAVRALGQRALLRNTPAAATTVRAGSHVAHAEELTPRQEEEINKTTFDFQPTPTGPWSEGFGRQQAYFNKVLIAGVTIFVLTLISGKILRSDMYWIDAPIPKTNPPVFTMKEMEKEALAAVEEEEE